MVVSAVKVKHGGWTNSAASTIKQSMTGGEGMKLRFATWIVVSLCFFALSERTQQTADVAYIEMVHVKPGNSEKFETTLKRHWGWHEKQGETWSYLVWTVDTGKNDGAYEIVSFGHTWKEVDESNALVAGTPPPEEDPEPYQQTVQESYYRYRPDLSIGSSVKQPSPVASVTQILLRAARAPARVAVRTFIVR
jgi:hypothetical protein